MNARIFVSYAREDQIPAGALVSFLRAAGFDIWFDKDNLHAGQDWRVVIEQEIARARLLIICLSQSTVDKTGFVQKEMRLALQQAELRPSSQVYIIPVSLDGCRVPIALERLHVLDLGVPDASRRLLEAIGNATGDGAKAPHDAHDAFTTAVSSYRRQLGEAVQSEDYSRRILGRWLGSRKYITFHADGRWGVQRNEDAPIEINGRRWRIQRNKLLLTFRGDAGLQTAERTITSFTTKRFITEADGHKETYDWAP
jgi:TIR domain